MDYLVKITAIFRKAFTICSTKTHKISISFRLRLIGTHLTTTTNVFLLLKMWVELEMGLCFPAKNLHLVLIKTFIRTELQLCRSVVEVNVRDGVADAFAEITCLCALKRRPSPEKEAIFRAEDSSSWSNNLTWLRADVLVTPRAIIFWKRTREVFFIKGRNIVEFKKIEDSFDGNGKVSNVQMSVFGQCHRRNLIFFSKNW